MGRPRLEYRIRRLRGWVAPLSPRHRRWKRFLRELPLDHAALPRPVDPPGERDFIICGSPRSGTTLLCAALFQPPEAVTVMEPWDGMRLGPAALFASLREELAASDRLERGRLDVAALLDRGVVEWCQEGTPTPVLSLGDGAHLLGVKWPDYWRYLDLLPDTKFLVCVRHPFEVIASYKQTGRLALGLQQTMAFTREINAELRAATRNPAVRRILLYDYINRRILPALDRPNVLTVRYERWFQDPARLLAKIGGFLGADLGSTSVRIRAPRSQSTLPEAEVELVRKHCTTAGPLGYDLSSWPVYGDVVS